MQISPRLLVQVRCDLTEGEDRQGCYRYKGGYDEQYKNPACDFAPEECRVEFHLQILVVNGHANEAAVIGANDVIVAGFSGEG